MVGAKWQRHFWTKKKKKIKILKNLKFSVDMFRSYFVEYLGTRLK